VRIAFHKGGRDSFYLLCLDADGSYQVEIWTISQFEKCSRLFPEFQLGVNFFALSDVSCGDSKYCDVFDGGLIVFSSPNPQTWNQSGKEHVKFFIMPLWEEEELCRFDTADKIFKRRFELYGGVARIVWGSDGDVEAHENGLASKDIVFNDLHRRLNTISWDTVPHRYVYLFVPKDETGKYQYEPKHVKIGIPTWHIASILSQMYITELLTNQSFGGNLPSLRGLLFEAMVLDLIQEHTGSCQFPLNILNNLKRKFPFSDAKGHSHLGTNLQVKFPSDLTKVSFHTENFLASVSTGSVFAQPISHYFPGFDAAVSFDQPLTSKSSPRSKKAKTASRRLALFQITTSMSHPLSRNGLDILTAVYESNVFQNVVIVFVVPFQNFMAFKDQHLAISSSSDNDNNLLKKTPQYCMTITTHGDSSNEVRMFSVPGLGAADN
jgi:hypothetical protein